MTSLVCSSVAPEGMITCAKRMPWSSSGRYAVGIFLYKKAIAATISTKTAKYRRFRDSECPTVRTYRLRRRKNRRSNPSKSGRRIGRAFSAGS